MQDHSALELEVMRFLADRPARQSRRPSSEREDDADDARSEAPKEPEPEEEEDSARTVFEIGTRVRAVPKTNQWSFDKHGFLPEKVGVIEYIHPKKRFYRVCFDYGRYTHLECFHAAELRAADEEKEGQP